MKLKFAVEEGDHITYLNGTLYSMLFVMIVIVYQSFIRENESAKWAHKHLLNLKTLQRVKSIRRQLEAYLKRFGIPIVSCNRDVELILKCLVSGYFMNTAKLHYDGTFRFLKSGSVPNSMELSIHPSSVLFRRIPQWVIFHEGSSYLHGFNLCL